MLNLMLVRISFENWLKSCIGAVVCCLQEGSNQCFFILKKFHFFTLKMRKCQIKKLNRCGIVNVVWWRLTFGNLKKLLQQLRLISRWLNQIEHVQNVACFKLQNKPNKRPRIHTFRWTAMSKVNSDNRSLLTNQSEIWTHFERGNVHQGL